MALGIYEEEDIRAIAKIIRNNLGNDTKYTTERMPDAINEMQVYAYNSGHSEGYDEGQNDGYNEGRNDGYTEGKTDGIAEGKKSQYDEFWDAYQRAINGISQIYSGSYMFANAGWNDDTFKPKYSMPYLNNAANMFNTCYVTDLSAALARQGVVFDFYKVASFGGTFSYMLTTTLPIIDTRGTTAGNNTIFSNMFNNSKKLQTIEKLILKDDGSQPFLNSFNYCESLENIVIEGVIGQNGLNLQGSPKLTHDSLMSIINALKDNSGTSTWNTITLGAENLAKLTPEELEIMDRKQWNYS